MARGLRWSVSIDCQASLLVCGRVAVKDLEPLAHKGPSPLRHHLLGGAIPAAAVLGVTQLRSLTNARILSSKAGCTKVRKLSNCDGDNCQWIKFKTTSAVM
jgi:hypothetical protein